MPSLVGSEMCIRDRSHTPPGAESNGGEGRESFSADANRDGAGTASCNAIAEIANALQQVLRMTNEGGTAAPTGTYTSRPIEIRQKVEMLAWTGNFERGQSVVSAFRLPRRGLPRPILTTTGYHACVYIPVITPELSCSTTQVHRVITPAISNSYFVVYFSPAFTPAVLLLLHHHRAPHVPTYSTGESSKRRNVS